MKTRTQILEEMASLDRMERGRLSQQYLKGMKDGKPVSWGPYYVLQRTEGRKHITRRIPADRAPIIQRDIDNHIRFQELSGQYARLTEELTGLQEDEPDAKKNAATSRPTSSRKRRPS